MKNHGVYISFIVNQEGTFVAKGAFLADVSVKENQVIDCVQYDFKFKQNYESKAIEHLITFDFAMAYERQPWWVENLEALKEAKLKKVEVLNFQKARQDVGKCFYATSPAKLTPWQETKLKEADLGHMYHDGKHYLIDMVEGAVFNPDMTPVAENIATVVLNNFSFADATVD